MTIDVRHIISTHFPENAFYCERIDVDKVFAEEDRAPFLELIRELKTSDSLAAHLACTPTLVVMRRNAPAKDGSIYVRLFEGAIRLEQWEKDTYHKWYPTDKTLLYAPGVPEFIWLSDFLSGKTAVRSKFAWQR